MIGYFYGRIGDDSSRGGGLARTCHNSPCGVDAFLAEYVLYVDDSPSGPGKRSSIGRYVGYNMHSSIVART